MTFSLMEEVAHMNSPDFGTMEFVTQREVNGKFICTGSFYCNSENGRFSYKLKKVMVPEGNRIFLACISLTMLSGLSGPFDDADAVYSDIIEIDGDDKGLYYDHPGKVKIGSFEYDRNYFESGYNPDFLHDTLNGEGGVWGHLFGPLPYKTPGDNPKTMRISTWLGEIQRHITFRLVANGDDWVGACFFVIQLS